MVVYVRMDNDCSKSKNMKVFNMPSNQIPLTNCNCSFGSKQSSHLLPEHSINKNTKTKLRIITDSAQPQNIGLHVNTNLQLKPKKNPGYRYVTYVLLSLLVGHSVWTCFQLHQLRSELDETKVHLDVLMERFDSMSTLFENVENRMKQLDGSSRENTSQEEDGHEVNKREAEPSINCTNIVTRQARSVNRGPFAIHLRGALPEITVRDGGIIAPWFVDKSSSGAFLLEDGVIGERKGIVEVIEEGLYFIYAQMYYLTSDSLNSYAINLQLGDGRGREDMVVAVCSAEAASSKLSELSCYTAVVRYLRRGDRIFLTQRERNRRIIFRENRSFLGLTLLNSPHGLTQ